MNIRKTKPLRLSIIFYQRPHHLTHALSGPRRWPSPRFFNRDRSGKMAGQTIIKNYIEQRKDADKLNTAQFLCFMKSSRVQKELDNSTNRSIDARLGAEYRFYRSRPSLAFHMTREITRQLIYHHPQRAPAHTADNTQMLLLNESKERNVQEEKIKIVREEFILTPRLLRTISDKVAAEIFRSMELERLRSEL